MPRSEAKYIHKGKQNRRHQMSPNLQWLLTSNRSFINHSLIFIINDKTVEQKKTFEYFVGHKILKTIKKWMPCKIN